MHDVVLVSDPEEPVRGLCRVLRAQPVGKGVLPQITSQGHRVGLCCRLLLV